MENLGEEVQGLMNSQMFVMEKAKERDEKNRKVLGEVEDLKEELEGIKEAIEGLDESVEGEARENLLREFGALVERDNEVGEVVMQKRAEVEEHCRQSTVILSESQRIMEEIQELALEISQAEAKLEEAKSNASVVKEEREGFELISVKNDIKGLEDEIAEIEKVYREEEIELESLKNEIDLYTKFIDEKEIEIKLLDNRLDSEKKILQESSENLENFKDYIKKKKSSSMLEEIEALKIADSSWGLEQKPQISISAANTTYGDLLNYSVFILIVILLVLILLA